MDISLEVTIRAHGTRFMRKGVFPVDPKQFQQASDHTAAKTAYEWIQKIKRDTGYAPDTEVLKAVYNEGNEITQLVKSFELLL
ncbi:hypothetical protein [Peribacillus deserti]|uniref:Uncharacterized protein n=1 Tax=Peribacillus deserti TaxID=673318 RepID=A0A2N5M6K5_9BACI|nr:hypothetical protein [Peribacillus deserti]PLT29996.1 hypothetical protein CUU66_09990 [Peribacillus deserti]